MNILEFEEFAYHFLKDFDKVKVSISIESKQASKIFYEVQAKQNAYPIWYKGKDKSPELAVRSVINQLLTADMELFMLNQENTTLL